MERSVQYSQLVERLLEHRSEFLKILHPTEPHKFYAAELPLIRQATDADLSGSLPTGPVFPAIRAGLFYCLDSLSDAEPLVRNLSGDLAAYWRGMIYRRQAEFELARNGYRDAGEMPFFEKLHQEACEHSALFARQETWDSYLFTGQCEMFKFGDDDPSEDLVRLQRSEFEVVFNYTWRQSVRGTAE